MMIKTQMKIPELSLVLSPPKKIVLLTSVAALLVAEDCLLNGALPFTTIPPQSPALKLT